MTTGIVLSSGAVTATETGLATAAAAGEVVLAGIGAMTPAGWAVTGTRVIGGTAYAIWRQLQPAGQPTVEQFPGVPIPPDRPSADAPPVLPDRETLPAEERGASVAVNVPPVHHDEVEGFSSLTPEERRLLSDPSMSTAAAIRSAAWKLG